MSDWSSSASEVSSERRRFWNIATRLHGQRDEALWTGFGRRPYLARLFDLPPWHPDRMVAGQVCSPHRARDHHRDHAMAALADGAPVSAAALRGHIARHYCVTICVGSV